MRVTERDRLIYQYIQENKFATVKQIGNVFFNDIIYRNELAKKRLNCLMEHKLIKSIKSTNCSQHIYYSNPKYKSQSYHNIVVMDFVSKLKEISSVQIVHMEREKSWTQGGTTVRSDAFIVIHFNGFLRTFIVEARTSNNSWIKSMEKYNEVMETVISESNGTIPTLISIDAAKHNMDEVDSFMKIIQIDIKLSDFPLIFDI